MPDVAESYDQALLRARLRAARELMPYEPAVIDYDELDGQCLAYAAAHQLRVPPHTLPHVPTGADRWEQWTGEMHALGYQVEDLPLDTIPPADGMPWIAVIHSGEATHAVACVGLTVISGHGEHRLAIQPTHVLAAFRITATA